MTTTDSKTTTAGTARAGLTRRTVLKSGSALTAGLTMPAVLRHQVAGQESAAIPAGMAMVSSPRLPITGIGSQDAADIFSGTITDWEAAGSPVSLPVELLAIEGLVPQGAPEKETFPAYEDLAAQLSNRPGAAALVPIDQVDFRANVIAVDGFDPLREPR